MGNCMLIMKMSSKYKISGHCWIWMKIFKCVSNGFYVLWLIFRLYLFFLNWACFSPHPLITKWHINNYSFLFQLLLEFDELSWKDREWYSVYKQNLSEVRKYFSKLGNRQIRIFMYVSEVCFENVNCLHRFGLLNVISWFLKEKHK